MFVLLYIIIIMNITGIFLPVSAFIVCIDALVQGFQSCRYHARIPKYDLVWGVPIPYYV